MLNQCFEYSKGDERVPMDEAMNLLLPMVQSNLVNTLLKDNTVPSLAMQRLVLKIFFALTQVGKRS